MCLFVYLLLLIIISHSKKFAIDTNIHVYLNYQCVQTIQKEITIIVKCFLICMKYFHFMFKIVTMILSKNPLAELL